MESRTSTYLAWWPGLALAALVVALANEGGAHAQSLPNACPVDGCEVTIVGVERAGGELALKFESNFSPDMSKNHIHVWWGEKYTVRQVSDNAETVHGVTQGDWHPTDEYPNYTTQSAVSTAVREGATTICVSAANRNHDILDAGVFHCVDVRDKL